jgi:glycosyltransferase involved in cell wall biosynthesis
MKFAMVTTFFGEHSFGGDAAYVDRLARSLLDHGHSVDVIYSPDSFDLLRKSHPFRTYEPPESLSVFKLHYPLKRLSQLMVHQTGKTCFYSSQLKRLIHQNKYDVIHFHNISLAGGPGLFSLESGSKRMIKIMTTHEHWLLCPLSLLWKYNRQVCESKACYRCTFRAGRPPQFWRIFSPPLQKLAKLDALICPSLFTKNLYSNTFLGTPIYQLPYCLPNDWPKHSESDQNPYSVWPRPYFAAAGRLVKPKGFLNLIPAMQDFPDYDLLIAGTGPLEEELKHKARNQPNVHFIGLLSEEELAALFKSAIAVIMPSLFYETFGYVALEAFSVKTPVILNNIGALPELVEKSGAGFVYKTEVQLIEAMKNLSKHKSLRQEMGEKGWQSWQKYWSESTHLEMYFKILKDLQ